MDRLRHTDVSATTNPTHGHVRPLRCAFELVVCQRFSDCVLSPCPGRGKVARTSPDSRVLAQAGGGLLTRVGSMARTFAEQVGTEKMCLRASAHPLPPAISLYSPAASLSPLLRTRGAPSGDLRRQRDG